MEECLSISITKQVFEQLISSSIAQLSYTNVPNFCCALV